MSVLNLQTKCAKKIQKRRRSQWIKDTKETEEAGDLVQDEYTYVPDGAPLSTSLCGMPKVSDPETLKT